MSVTTVYENRSALPLPLLALAWIVGLIALAFIVSVPMTVIPQLMFSGILFVIGLILKRIKGQGVVLVMMGLSLTVSTRYMWWRLNNTMGSDNSLDLILGFGLLLAEIYAFVILVLGFFQVIWPLARKPVPLPQDQSLWPTVDVYVPTYNEPLSVVRSTLLASTVIDWPADKLQIYLLDDGRRDDFREFCEQLGVNYVVRNENSHAKAGNINAALKTTKGQFITIFDCDHVPTRSFLQIGMGWFLREEKLALMQMPHYFFSPDPFERNLDTYGKVPNEGELFYGLLQDGNDQWDATFFCGSCAILRRGPLEKVGGVAVETVTEDAHTALKMHRLGYNSAYLTIPQAAGLATESLSGHVAQRIRWARGMAQIFRVDNPFLTKGLRWSQRLCYANAMTHFFYGLPRIVYLTAPLGYLFFGAHVIHASASMILAYAIPHLLQAGVTNLRTQGKFRHLLWNEVYETTLAWYIFRPTLVAMLNPKLGKFNVTPKGGLIDRNYFDAQIAKPYLYLLLLNVAGGVAGLLRLMGANTAGQVQTIMFNLAWTIYNMLLLGATIATASESRQVRQAHRVPLDVEATLHLPDKKIIACRTVNFSTGGMALRVQDQNNIVVGMSIQIGLTHRNEERLLPAIVRHNRQGIISVQFEEMNIQQERWLIASTFARADIWLSQWGKHDRDSFFVSMRQVLGTSMRGFGVLGLHLLRVLHIYRK